MDALMQIELAVTHFLQSLGVWLQYPMQAFTFLGNELFFLLVMPAIYWSIDATIGFRTGMMLILSGGLNSAFKILFHSPRPFWVDRKVTAYASEISFGLPSGHSQNSAAIWGIIAASKKKKWLTILVILVVFFIGVSRIYLGVHFLRDVLLGWLIGALIVLAYMKLEPSVSAWLVKKTVSQQYGVAFLLSIVLILLGLLSLILSNNYPPQDAWIQNALAAGAERPAPFSMDGILTIAGVAFGFGSGYAWWRHKFNGYTINCSPVKRLARYLVGLVGIVILYFGLKMILPEEPLLLGWFTRYFRYALIGFWVTGLAPLVFRLLRLDR
jgi:membrane-associated phospholipid phosphatase